MKLSIQRAGLKHLQVITGCAEKKGSMEKMIAGASVIVCSSLVEDRLRALVPKTKELIVDNKRIDQAGIAMLRSRLLEMKPGGDSREISPEPVRIP
jgi:hypothetical protein